MAEVCRKAGAPRWAAGASSAKMGAGGWPARGKPIFLPASLKVATARRENVLHPFRLAAVRERNDEAVRRSKDVDGCTVDLAGLSSDVGQDAEARKPARENAGDPVREGNVDLCQPSLAKPHHENA